MRQYYLRLLHCVKLKYKKAAEEKFARSDSHRNGIWNCNRRQSTNRSSFQFNYLIVIQKCIDLYLIQDARFQFVGQFRTERILFADNQERELMRCCLDVNKMGKKANVLSKMEMSAILLTN